MNMLGFAPTNFTNVTHLPPTILGVFEFYDVSPMVTQNGRIQGLKSRANSCCMVSIEWFLSFLFCAVSHRALHLIEEKAWGNPRVVIQHLLIFLLSFHYATCFHQLPLSEYYEYSVYSDDERNSLYYSCIVSHIC